MKNLIAWFEREFAPLEQAWRELIQATDDDRLYQSDGQHNPGVDEQVLKSARIVEQTFGGITANLWDDPFERTLPETLTSRTGGGGLHLVFRIPDGRTIRSRSKLPGFPGIEVKAEDGSFTAPPSRCGRPPDVWR